MKFMFQFESFDLYRVVNRFLKIFFQKNSKKKSFTEREKEQWFITLLKNSMIST